MESNKKEVAPANSFLAKLEAYIGKGSALEHEDTKMLMKEAAAMIVQHEKPPEVICPFGEHYNECRQCIRKAADYAVKRTTKPFCCSQQAWKVIDYTPIFGRPC